MHHFVERFGDIFSSFRGMRLAQAFVMFTFTQQLANGLAAGLLHDPVYSRVQAYVITVISGGQCALGYLRFALVTISPQGKLLGVLRVHRPLVPPGSLAHSASLCTHLRVPPTAVLSLQ
jgi:hypothetical protein